MSDPVTVKTAGVGSPVFDADREVVGHVVLLDLDGADSETAVETAREIDGPAVVCRSSVDGWHVAGLRPRPWADVLDALREHSEPEHVATAEREQRATLRVKPKWDAETGEVVTPAPVPVEVVNGDGPVSKPHIETLIGLDPTRSLLDSLDHAERVGETLSTAVYGYEVDDGR